MVFLTGIGLMLSPLVKDYLNRWRASRAVAEYDQETRLLAPADYSRVIIEAEDYNRRLRENPNPLSEESRTAGYREALAADASGIMGYLTIEKIHVRLPFYHGTEGSVLETAVGHLEGTSLPIGGVGTHSCLSAHRGLPSAKLFTDLAELEPGDRFTVTVLDRKLGYEVDQLLTVLPSETEALAIEEGKDYCTLMTCTPYGINTHRLLVRGHRVEEISATGAIEVAASPNSSEGAIGSGVNGDRTAQERTAAGRSYDRWIPGVVVLLTFIFLLLLFGPDKKKKKKNRRKETE